MSEATDAVTGFLMRAVEDVLRHDLERFSAEKPDYVITDSVAPWGQWVGQLLDLPVVTSVGTLAINRQVMAFAASRGTRPKSLRRAASKIRHVLEAAALGRRLRRTYGVPGTGIIGLIAGSSDLTIVYTSRAFQPCAGSFDDRFLFIGPAIGWRPESDHGAAPAWPPGVIYVSLGTVFNARPDFYRACFEAFRGRDVRVLMAVGSNLPVEPLGTPPPNVEVRPWVPQLEVLRQAAVFVSHGGMNSVSESLAHGVPLVVVPQMGEQETIGRQVDALGAGVFLAPEAATPERLWQAVERVRNDGRFGTAAAGISRSFEEAGGVARGAEAIHSYVRRARGPGKLVG
jgi:MGT family glycosyltransferase